MDIFKLTGIALSITALTVTVRKVKPELGMQTALAGGAVLLAIGLTELSGLADTVRSIMGELGQDGGITELAFKVTGIAYMTQLAADVCRDSGETALASKTELCGRLIMVSAAVPTITRLTGLIAQLAEEYL